MTPITCVASLHLLHLNTSGCLSPQRVMSIWNSNVFFPPLGKASQQQWVFSFPTDTASQQPSTVKGDMHGAHLWERTNSAAVASAAPSLVCAPVDAQKFPLFGRKSQALNLYCGGLPRFVCSATVCIRFLTYFERMPLLHAKPPPGRPTVLMRRISVCQEAPSYSG